MRPHSYANPATALFLTSLIMTVYFQPAVADELSLYFYPSPVPIDWSTPTTLTSTTVTNSISLAKHPIGHVNVELTCKDDPQIQHHILTGMTSAKGNESTRLIFKKKYGLGVLFHDLKGALVEPKKMLKELKKLYRRGKVSVLSYGISPSTCARLAKYHNEYVDAEYWQHYGLPNRPRHREGSGCSAFGTSFLDLAGLLTEPHFQVWSQTKLVPHKYVGGPLTGNKVPLGKLLFPGKKTRWATPDENHFELFFWDPDLMHQWAVKTWKLENKSPSGEYELRRRGKSYELYVDKSHLPTPTQPIWL